MFAFGATYWPDASWGWSVVGVADFNGDGYPDYLLFNANYTCNSDLVYEQQRSCYGGAWPDASGGLERGRSCGFQWRQPSRLSAVQSEHARHSDLVYVRRGYAYRQPYGADVASGLERGGTGRF